MFLAFLVSKKKKITIKNKTRLIKYANKLFWHGVFLHSLGDLTCMSLATLLRYNYCYSLCHLMTILLHPTSKPAQHIWAPILSKILQATIAKMGILETDNQVSIMQLMFEKPSLCHIHILHTPFPQKPAMKKNPGGAF